MSGDAAWYVYALMPDGAKLPDVPPGLLPDAPVIQAGAAGLCAVVSQVPRHLFAAESAAARDPAWVAARAAAHHAVVVAVAAAGPCLPLGFGTLFSSAAALRAWLRREAPAALAALDQLGHRAEWVLRLREDEARHTAWHEANDAGLAALAAQAQTAGPGAAFLIGKRRAKALQAARAAHEAALASQVRAQLAALSDAVLADGPAGWALLAAHGADVPARLAALADALAPSGFDLHVTGPWPPYGFARAAWAPTSQLEAAHG